MKVINLCKSLLWNPWSISQGTVTFVSKSPSTIADVSADPGEDDGSDGYASMEDSDMTAPLITQSHRHKCRSRESRHVDIDG